MKKSESNRKRKRVETDECKVDFKENFQPFHEKQFPGILKESIRTSDSESRLDTQTRVILSRPEEKTKNLGETEEDREYTGSFQLTKKRKQRDPSSTVMADHNETCLAAQPSDISKSLTHDENIGTISQTMSHKCLICSKLCARKNHLTNHMKSHKKETRKTNMITVGVPPEENVVGSYRCLICFGSFSRLNYLNNHMKFTHDKNPLASKKSTKSPSVQRRLKSHGSSFTRKSLFKCGFCEKSFSYSHNRDRHLRTHLGEKPYGCHICEKSFVQKVTLSMHLKTHIGKMLQSQRVDSNGQQTGVELFAGKKLEESNEEYIGDKRYKCPSCPVYCHDSSHLKIHVRIHTGERPYTCQHCLKAFAQSSALKSHLRIHTGEKPYKCKYCHKLFRHISNLTVHLKTHPDEKL